MPTPDLLDSKHLSLVRRKEIGSRLRAAERNVSCFYQREDFVAGLKFQFLDRARCNDRRDITDARLDDYFTDDFVGHDAFHGSRELVSGALFHNW